MQLMRQFHAKHSPVKKRDSLNAATHSSLRPARLLAATRTPHTVYASWRSSGSASEEATGTALCLSDFKLEAPVHPREATNVNSSDPFSVEEEYDILGLGQLMIDYAAAVDYDMLAALNVPKGGRRVVSVEERAAVMERLQGFNSQVSAGGSLANSLVGISQLAAARERTSAKAAAAAMHTGTHSSRATSSSTTTSSKQHRIRVGMVGCCGGSDALGEFGRAQMTAAGVDIISLGDDVAPCTGSATGTVMVFTTPDAQRSFLSSFSSEDQVQLSPELLAAVSRARLLVIEGYLWELPGSAEVIPEVVRHARSVGTLVVLTAGDASVVQRHGDKVLQAIQSGVDMFVSNVGEATELVQHLRQQQQQQQQKEQQPPEQQQQHHVDLQYIQLDPQGSMCLDSYLGDSGSSEPENSNSYSTLNGSSSSGGGSSSEGQEAACELAGVCPLVVVTDGSRGSYITALGQLIVVPPYWRSVPPIDTCGAGDAYCSGLLFAFLLGLDLHAMGHIAAKTASAVISRHGPQLLSGDADWVAAAPLGAFSNSSGLAARFMSSAVPVRGLQVRQGGNDRQLLQGASH